MMRRLPCRAPCGQVLVWPGASHPTTKLDSVCASAVARLWPPKPPIAALKCHSDCCVTAVVSTPSQPLLNGGEESEVSKERTEYLCCMFVRPLQCAEVLYLVGIVVNAYSSDCVHEIATFGALFRAPLMFGQGFALLPVHLLRKLKR